MDGLIEFDITASENSPQIYEFEVFLEMPAKLDFCVVSTHVVDRRQGAAFRNALASRGAYLFTHSSETILLNPNAPQMFDDKGNGLFSTVLLDWIEWEGPLVSDEERSRRQDVMPPDNATPEVVAEHLHRFAQRAWRRPVEQDELEDYMQTYLADREAGEELAEAYRGALLGILTSRNLLYIVEGHPIVRERLTDWELASRLSYFLWSSMPDEALFSAAESGSLCATDRTTDPTTDVTTERTTPFNSIESPIRRTKISSSLASEVERMLTDGRIHRFIDDFSRQWLQLHRVGMFPPDKKLYPNYDAWLERVCVRNRSSTFAKCLRRTCPSRTFSILIGPWLMQDCVISMDYPSLLRMASSVSRSGLIITAAEF